LLAGKRAKRVGDLILKGIAELLTQKVRDPRVNGVTLTGLYLSNDLKNAKVYFSIIGDGGDVVRAQSGLDSAKGYIKREVGNRIKLRYFPEITFEHDPTLETGNRMEGLLKKIRVEDL
jgi:ribosome-binding factor A